MSETVSRRGFFKGAAAFGVTLPTAGALGADASAPKSYKTELHKAFICPQPEEEIIRAHADAGFEGVELRNHGQTDEEIKADLQLLEKYSLRVHSLIGGGADFNNGDPSVRAAGQEKIRRAIQMASLYGADTLLLVPGRIGGRAELPVPDPADLNIQFDPETLNITSVADGDNTPYRAYIEAHNRSATLIFDEIAKLIPTAAQYGVSITVENVGNNLWLQPEIFADFIRKFDDLWVKAYYDMGNHAKYAPTSRWLRTLGKSQIAKLHLKDYAVQKGICPLGTGTIDWLDVRGTVEEIGYSGWVTYEEECQTDYSPADYARLMDRWFAGQPMLG